MKYDARFLRNVGDFVIRALKRHPLMISDEILFRLLSGKIATLPYPPREVSISITGACTNRCLFCAHHSLDAKNDPALSKLYNLPYRLSYNDFCKIVDVAYKSRVPNIHIVASGEPFTHADILRMMDYTIDLYGSLSIFTNFHKALFEKNNYIDEIIKRSDHIHTICTDILSYYPKIHEHIKIGSDYTYLLNSLEHISKSSDIHFSIMYIYTKQNYRNVHKLVELLYSREVDFNFNIISLDPYNFNDFTSPSNAYMSSMCDMTRELNVLKETCNELKVNLNVSPPIDVPLTQKADYFWKQIHFSPTRAVPESKWNGNAYIRLCMGVVKGDLSSLGNLYDYDSLMDFWNNDKYKQIRKNLLKGIYPSDQCKFCYQCPENSFVRKR